MSEHSPNSKAPPSRLHAALAPLADLGEGATREYQREAKTLQMVERKCQAVKSLYATAFQRSQSLEQVVNTIRQQWQDEPC